jgi:hypothetical protein
MIRNIVCMIVGVGIMYIGIKQGPSPQTPPTPQAWHEMEMTNQREGFIAIGTHSDSTMYRVNELYLAVKAPEYRWQGFDGKPCKIGYIGECSYLEAGSVSIGYKDNDFKCADVESICVCTRARETP